MATEPDRTFLLDGHFMMGATPYFMILWKQTKRDEHNMYAEINANQPHCMPNVETY